MTFSASAKNIYDKLNPFYQLLVMIAFLAGITLAIYKFVFSPAELSIIVKREKVDYPSNIKDQFQSLSAYISDTLKAKELSTQLMGLQAFLLVTRDKLTLVIQNETDHTLKKVNLRLTNASQLTSWGASSDYLTNDELDKLIDRVTWKDREGIVDISDIGNLPPKASLNIYLWGDFKYLDEENGIFLTYDDGVGKKEKEILVRGFTAYFVSSLFEWLLVILILFCYIYYRQAIKLRNKQDATS